MSALAQASLDSKLVEKFRRRLDHFAQGRLDSSVFLNIQRLRATKKLMNL